MNMESFAGWTFGGQDGSFSYPRCGRPVDIGQNINTGPDIITCPLPRGHVSECAVPVSALAHLAPPF